MLLCSRCKYELFTRFKYLKNTGFRLNRKFTVVKPESGGDKKLNKLYSDTVLLPKTTFNAYHEPSRELEIQKSEAFQGLYERQRKDASRQVEFVLHDGPPYANGTVHLGHAVNKILKDIICRYKLLDGHKVHYIPGWDCHGLPIELKAVDTNKDGKKVPIETRTIAEKFALKTVDDQMSAFKRWGVMGDWNSRYTTLSRDYVVNQLRAFRELSDKGLIYKDYLPVYWSLDYQTALAEAELEYDANYVSQSLYVKFKIAKCPLDISTSNLYALIWTTTPWTLVSNQAVAYADGKTYCVVSLENSSDQIIVASEMIDTLSKTLNRKLEVLKTFESSQLRNFTYIHPLKASQEQNFFDGSHVKMSKGTGLVHIASNHGKEDYAFALKHGIKLERCDVDEKGCFTEGAGVELKDKFVLKDGNAKVMDMIQDNILFKENYSHSYPCDWRSKNPVIIRASQQWFMNIDKIRSQCIDALNKTTYYPESFKVFLINQLEERPQWCISRQRSWGVPIPAFYHVDDKDGHKPIMTDDMFAHLTHIFEKFGPNVWWQYPTEKLLPANCSHEELRPGRDIMDIWFDSGMSWQSVLPDPKVADVYLEGYDQLRGWFQSSLITSVALRGCAPYKAVFIHGFTLDENGKKMSKSEGNIIDPMEIVNGKKGKKSIPANGSDALRWWVFSCANDHTNVKFSREKFTGCRERMKKIRGILRFILGVLSDFDDSKMIRYDQLLVTDRMMLNRLSCFDARSKDAMNSYNLETAARELNTFLIDDLSAFYCSITKNRLYCHAADSTERQSCQTAYVHILNNVLQKLSPVLPHMMEEFYTHLPEWLKTAGAQSVFERNFPAVEKSWSDERYDLNWLVVNGIVETVNKSYPSLKMRDLDLYLSAPDKLISSLRPFQPNDTSSDSELCEIFQVAKVNFVKPEFQEDSAKTENGFEVTLDKNLSTIKGCLKHSEGISCPRCRRKVAVKHGKPCDHCVQVLANSYKN
ncbi:Mitochondiral isoleucine--tRNA ligase [Halotydeus destructor]|nr:Mitochondiral isoleucine--tRNA ligase [Halotydeus destructor]